MSRGFLKEKPDLPIGEQYPLVGQENRSDRHYQYTFQSTGMSMEYLDPNITIGENAHATGVPRNRPLPRGNRATA
jgi:hypothetical protein